MDSNYIFSIANKFKLSSPCVSAVPFGNGHINSTFKVTCENGEKYILQQMNDSIFKETNGLTENIVKVTSHIRNKIVAQGKNPNRSVLTPIKTKNGAYYLTDENQKPWRVYLFISDGICSETIDSADMFYETGVVFGEFLNMLADFPAEELNETIPKFHDEKDRFNNFMNAVNADKVGRVSSVTEEIEFVKAHKADTDFSTELLEKAIIPIRVTHNDTKTSNVMMDKATGKGLCVLDLDTVMPGLAIFDFGDAVRTGACTAPEDEPDTSKISLDLDLFEAFTKGYLKSCGSSLTQKEKELLPFGAKIMTFEFCMRSLTDYLEGDVYYKISHPEHNLERCRSQMTLVKDIEAKMEDMKKIVSKYM